MQAREFAVTLWVNKKTGEEMIALGHARIARQIIDWYTFKPDHWNLNGHFDMPLSEQQKYELIRYGYTAYIPHNNKKD